MERLGSAMASALLAVAALSLATYTVAVAYTVAARYLFSSTPYWAEELPRLLLMWSTFLAAAVAVYRNSHLRADLLGFLPLPAAAHRAAAALGEVAVLAYLVIMAVVGWQLSMRTMALDTTALEIPAGFSYLPLPLGFASAAVLLVLSWVLRAKGRWN